MNANTFTAIGAGYPAGHPFQLASQTLASTTETAFLFSNGNAAIIAVPTQNAIVGSYTPMDPNANAALLADVYGAMSERRYLAGRPYFTSTSFDLDRPFRLRLCGRGAAVTGGGNTLTLNVYQGTSTSVVGTAGNIVATSGAVAMATTHPFGFYMTVTMAWDSMSQALYGTFDGAVLYNATTQTTIASTALSHVVSVPTYTGLSFLVTATWGAAAGGTTVMSEMSLEQV